MKKIYLIILVAITACSYNSKAPVSSYEEANYEEKPISADTQPSDSISEPAPEDPAPPASELPAPNGHKPNSDVIVGSGYDSSSESGYGYGSGSGRMGGSSRGEGMGGGGIRVGTSRNGHTSSSPNPPQGPTVEPGQQVDSPEAPEELDLVDSILAKFKTGNVAFNSPKEMKVSESEIVELALSFKESSQNLAAKLSGTNIETAEGVKLAPRMEATLTGTNFSIKEMAPAEQAISGSQTTKWSWAVSADKPGIYILHLSLSTRIEVEGKDTPFIVNTFERKIKVNAIPVPPVTLSQQALGFLNDNWKWLWSTIVVPAAIWLWNRKRKNAKQTQGS